MLDLKVHYVNKVPVAVLDNFFTEYEHNAIFDEITRMRMAGLLRPPEETGSATHDDDSLKKVNSAVWFPHVYRIKEMSPTEMISPKLISPTVVNELINHDVMFRFLTNINSASSLFSYYNNSDRYEAHTDTATFTLLHWLYKEPKGFEGGDFIIEDKLSIECKNNRVVYMPSFLEHAVTPVKLKGEPPWVDGWGRHTISHFLHGHMEV